MIIETPLFYNLHLFAGVAQLVEHNLAKVDVVGSNPTARSNKYIVVGGLAQLVEHRLDKAMVAGSIPASTTTNLLVPGHGHGTLQTF